MSPQWLQFSLALAVPLLGVAYALGSLSTRVKNLEDKQSTFQTEVNNTLKDFKTEIKDEFKAVNKTINGVQRYVEQAILSHRVAVVPFQEPQGSKPFDSHEASGM